MHAAEAFVSVPTCFEVVIVIENLEMHKSPGSDKVRQKWSKQEKTHYILIS
jgi:hypothetical protein